jgi:NDP-sugar pyrophosphorylase family protein
MKAMILAAGYGTRLGDLTREIPKPMLPIGDRPLLEYTVRLLVKHGFTDLAINLHFLPDFITEHFGDGERFGARITYSHEPHLLGTAGALKKLETCFREEPAFLVVYGDILTDLDLSALMAAHRAKAAYATLTLHQRNKSNSIVTLDEHWRIVNFVERPSEEERAKHASLWVNSGIQVLSGAVLDDIPPDRPSDLPKDIYLKQFHRQPIYGFPLEGFRCAIDSPERLQQARDAVATGRLAL